MTAFLSRDELIELTGYKIASKQIEWLTRNGVRHWVAKTGRPQVPRSVIDGAGASDKESQPFEPRYVA